MYFLKLGVSVVLDDNFEDNIKKIASLEFDSVDLDLSIFYGEKAKQYNHFKKNISKAFDLIYSNNLICNGVHLSYGPLMDFSNPDEKTRQENVDYCKSVMDLLDNFNFKCYIIHGSFEPIEDSKREFHKQSLLKSLPEIISYTNKLVCLEDLPRSCLCNTSEELMEFIEGCDNLYACVDVNHFLKEKSEPVILKLGKHIKTLHISDYDYINERHWLPGQGKIDWMLLLKNLETIGYDGVFNYELSYPYEDILDNYHKMFNDYNGLKWQK